MTNSIKNTTSNYELELNKTTLLLYLLAHQLYNWCVLDRSVRVHILPMLLLIYSICNINFCLIWFIKGDKKRYLEQSCCCWWPGGVRSIRFVKVECAKLKVCNSNLIFVHKGDLMGLHKLLYGLHIAHLTEKRWIRIDKIMFHKIDKFAYHNIESHLQCCP